MPDNTIPTVTFAAFVSSFTATGAMAIQQIEQAASSGEGGDGDSVPDMAQALATFQHLIETLQMLETKTSGNLSDDETKALEAALNDLKFGYVQLKEHH
jgi:Domain of unknown function (DUF1844)